MLSVRGLTKRFGGLVAVDGVGFDVAQTDGQGRLVQVLGFLDRVPAA